MKHQTPRLLPFFASVAVVIGVLIGAFYANHFSGRSVSFINTSSNKLSDLLHIIDERYVDTVKIGELVEKAMPKILRELDPHSTYISAKNVAESMQDLKGSFSGIGVQFTLYEDTVRIVRVLEGGPSQRVGLRAGDRIVQVDGKPYVGKVVNNEETMKRLKGEAGSTVKLGVKRNGEKRLLDFSITRGDVPVKSVTAAYMLDESKGYLRIDTWGDNTYAEFLAAMATLTSQGMEELVIDLRGNLGGYLQAAVQVANEFLPARSLIVYNEGRRFAREDFKSDGRGAYQHTPLIVLVDETSASASEIFAGAMQDNDRATLVGRRTFGKGLVQVPIEFRDGSMLRLTTARYYTPSGRCVQKPFTPGDEEAYEADLLERAATGEYFSSAQIKVKGKKFFTRLGRPVYDGGGITPDHFIPRDTTGITSYFKEVYLDGTMYQFAYWFVDQHRTELTGMKNYNVIAKYLKRNDMVEQFVRYAERHGNRRRNLMIRTSHALLTQHLTSYIISNTLDEQASTQYINESDPAVLRAVKLLNEGAAFPQAPTKSKSSATAQLYEPTKVRGSLTHSAAQSSLALRESGARKQWRVARCFARTRRFLFG